MSADDFSFRGLACLTVADVLPTGEDQRRGILAGAVEGECLFTTGLARGSLLRASGQGWRCYGVGARGKLGRVEGLRRRSQEEGSSKSSGLVEEGDEGLNAVLASVVGPGLDDEENEQGFE